MEPTSDRLMLEMGWARRLARALLRDDAAADDVAQETWLVAAAQQPEEDRPLRPWLARVVRNLVRTRRRGDARRDDRDAAYEDLAGRTVATPDELVERVELQRMVAGEVLALAEPYRSTVLLHFVEGLTSAQIARRLGVPDGTVRRRLKTALDRLRAQLRDRGDRPARGWLAALAPLARLPEPAAPPTLVGAFLVKKIVAIVVVLVLVLAGALLWKHRRGGAVDDDASPTATAAGAQPPRPAGAMAPASIPAWLAQTGVAPRRIAGRVVADGAPLAGATVRLGLPQGGTVQLLAELTSAADGTFDFGEQPAARFAVSAQAEAHAPASLIVASADPRAKPDALVLELGDCRSRISGTISDASGGGIAKARLSIDGLAGAETDATGRYAMCLTPREELDTPAATIRIEAAGYGATTQNVILAGELHRDFVLVPEAVLAGRVVTADDRPVPGARVLAEPDHAEGPHHVASGWAESDADGHFRIAGLAPGKFQLLASAQGLGSATPVIAFARATTTSSALRIVVAPLARVTGRVVASGAPVPGARVTATAPSSGQARRAASAVSQPDGTFTLDGVPFGAVALTAAPFAVSAPKTLDIAQAQLDGVTLEVGKLATLRGRVLRKGRPVSGAEVQFAAPEAPPATARTDADGAYVLEGLPSGDGQVYAWSLRQGAFTDAKAVQLAAGEERALDLELDLAGEVKGTVVDEAGATVPGVYVRMDLANNGDHCETLTDAGGNFDCTTLAGGEYTPRVAPSPSTGHAFAPATGDALATIVVPKDGVVTGVRLAIKHERFAIRGTVVDDTGAAVPDVHVEAIGRGYRVSTDLASVMTDANGRFEIANLARGTYSLHAHAADGAETEAFNVATGELVTITLARPGGIEGTLVGFSTTPIVETATVTTDLRIGGNAVVDGTTFSRPGIPPGRYTVEAKAGLESDGVAVDVHPGETVHVTLRSRGTGRIEGTITELGTKAPLAGMRCDANLSMGGRMSGSPPDTSRRAFTDAAGHFSLPSPTGRIRVFCFNPDGGLSSAGTDVDVTAGAVPHVDLVAVRGVPTGDLLHRIGFDLQPLELPIAVNTVDPTGPAAGAGIAPGDRLVAIDGQVLVDGVLPQGAVVLLLNHRPGAAITLALERGGVARTAKLVAR